MRTWDLKEQFVIKLIPYRTSFTFVFSIGQARKTVPYNRGSKIRGESRKVLLRSRIEPFLNPFLEFNFSFLTKQFYPLQLLLEQEDHIKPHYSLTLCTCKYPRPALYQTIHSDKVFNLVLLCLGGFTFAREPDPSF